ncbi:SAM-dependent methyltransferase [Sarocladium implicatum]|nr:SAM-dependent methyltransferase [Sarocladium implicatum]
MTKFKRNAQSQPKHGHPSVSSASKAPVAPPVRRPGWTGPSYIRKAAKQTPAAVKDDGSTEQIQSLSVQHQQLVLDTIRTTFPAVDEFNALKPVLRAVREALEKEDYATAFGTDEFLEAYTIRWSPSRALTVATVLAWMCSEMREAAWVQQFLDDSVQKPSKIVCLGRGGSDLLACAALLKHSHQSKLDEMSRLESTSPVDPNCNDSAMVDLNLIDRHDWSGIITKLQHTLTHPPPLSKYATAKAHASNVSAIPPQAMNVKVNHFDILERGTSDLRAMIGPGPALITFFFSLHELYSTSISKTAALLLRLTSTAPKGSILLVVNRPGDDVALPDRVNKGQEKRYPLEWLLYQTLLPPRSRPATSTDPEEEEEEEKPAWAKLIEGRHDKEYKLPAGLRFPGSLENTRFQVHMLERL